MLNFNRGRGGNFYCEKNGVALSNSLHIALFRMIHVLILRGVVCWYWTIGKWKTDRCGNANN